MRLSYKTLHKFGYLWLLIFRHNSVKAGYFKSHQDALISLQRPEKFSVLGAITQKAKIDGYYEFLLRYPYDNYELHWKQLKNPIDSTYDIGYTPIDVDNKKFPFFSGLALSADTKYTLLDGTIGNTTSNWYYCIGATGALSNYWQPYIPSRYIYNKTEEVQLWLRINTTDDIQNYPNLVIQTIPSNRIHIRCSLLFIIFSLC